MTAAFDLTLTDAVPDPTVLDRLARDRTPHGRRQLIEMLADAYLHPERVLNATDAALLDTFIDEIFKGSVPRDIRQLLAVRAARAKTITPAIARKLSIDEIEIAAPLLQMGALADADLLTVIGITRTPHRLAIAGRAAVSEAVADALVLTGDVAVVETLLKNFGARLSRTAVTKCVELAKQLQALRLPLVRRAEFTAADASQLLWWLPRELRQVVSDRFGPVMSGQQPTLAMITPAEAAQVGTKAQLPVAEQLQLWAQQNSNVPLQGPAAARAALWLSQRQAITGETLTRVLRLRLSGLFVAMLAQATGLSVPLIERACAHASMQGGGQVFAVFCRALRIEKAQFASLFMLVQSAFQNGQSAKTPLQPAALGQMLEAYDRIGARAGAMLQAWRDNPELLRARI